MASKRRFDSEGDSAIEKAMKGRIDPMPLVNGIGSYEAALRAHQAAHRHDADARIKRAIAEKLKKYDSDRPQ